MSFWRWHTHLAPIPSAARLSLGEGDTPLVRSRRLGPSAGLQHLYFKLEMLSPSGSYKDRFAVAAVSHMVAESKRVCVATSSGNTGAALAMYCAVAGIRCEIAIVETAPSEKLQQMLAYGARLYRVEGFGANPEITARVLELIQSRSQAADAAMQVSAFRYSPVGMTGVRTVSFELAEQLPEGIDHVFCPAGGGGLVVAAAQGFELLAGAGRWSGRTAIECVQPEGNDTISSPLRDGAPRARAVRCTSKISGLQVASVIDGDEALVASRASGGSGHLVTDDEVWQVQARLAVEEGIFTEPAGAVAVAGALRAAAERRIDPDARVVCLVTGFGFKDQPSVARMNQGRAAPLIPVEQFAQALSAP